MKRLGTNSVEAFPAVSPAGSAGGGPKVLVIEGEEISHSNLIEQLELEGFIVQAAKTRAQANGLLRSLRFSAIIGELKLSDGDCEQVYREALSFAISTPAIFIVSAGEFDQAIRLVKAGAADCIQKPVDAQVLIARLRALVGPQQTAPALWPEPTMTSAATQELATRMKRIVMTRMRVFITGESGSGKEVVARYFHRISPCCDQPFVAVRCASLAGPFGDHLLFGEKVRIAEGEDGEYRQGALEQSGRGILFLDEVDEMPPAVQSKLVQVIDSGRFSRVGEVGSYMPFEARIISASDIPSRLLRERMRPDLLDRLAVFELCVPPLRERQGDIEPLTRALLPDIALDLGVPPVPIDPHAMAAFRTYDWPGNVRELRNRLTRGLSFAKGPKIGADELFPDLRLSEHGEMRETTLGEMRANADRQHIAQALARHNGRIGDAASSLGISRVTLWSKMKRLGMLHTE